MDRIGLNNKMRLASPADPIAISAEDARRLAVARERLAGKLPAKATREHILVSASE